MLWEVALKDHVEEALCPTRGVSDDIDEELWIQSRRLLLERKVDEVHRESTRLSATRIISMIPDKQISVLRERLREPVTLSEFTAIILASVPGGLFTEREWVVAVHELFAIIDINGNGSIDWEELSHYVIHAYDAQAESFGGHIAFSELAQYKTPAERCRHRSIYYFRSPDKMVTLDTCGGGTAQLDHSTLSVFLPSQCTTTQTFKPYATLRSEYTYQCAEWVTPLNQLVVSTANGLLQYYHIKDVKDETRADTIQHYKHNFLGTSILKLFYDNTHNLLFCGSHRGGLLAVVPDDSVMNVPVVQYSTTPHDGHPITDVLALETIGAKKVASSALDARCLINDVETGVVERELCGDGAKQIVNNLSYSTDYSLLVTSGHFDPEPALWTPLAGQFISKLRDVDQPHKGKIIKTHCVQQGECGVDSLEGCSLQHDGFHPWHLLSADSLGVVKVWDIRKVAVLQTVSLNRSVVRKEDKRGRDFKFYDIAVDTTRGWLMSAARTDTERVAKIHKHVLVGNDNGHVAHDGPVSFLLYSRPIQCYATFCNATARLWDAQTGTLKESFMGLAKSPITAVLLDRHERRFVMGCHDGTVLMRTLSTGGVAATFQRCPYEVSHIFETQADTFLVFALDNLYCYKYTESHESIITPVFTVKLAAKVTSWFYYPGVSVYGLGDSTEGVTIVDTYSKARAKVLGVCRYAGFSNEKSEEADIEGDVVQMTEQRLRVYLHPVVGEVSCLVGLAPYPLVAAGDSRGWITLYTLRPHPFPYQVCSRWKINQYHKSTLSPPVTISLTWDGKTLYSTDDHGCVSSWNISAVITANALVPSRFPYEDGDEVGEKHRAPLQVLQAEVVTTWPAHQCMETVNGLHLICDNVFCSYGTDRQVAFWDSLGQSLGHLEQSKVYKDDTTVVPACYTVIAQRLKGQRGGHSEPSTPLLRGSDALEPLSPLSEESQGAQQHITENTQCASVTPKNEVQGVHVCSLFVLFTEKVWKEGVLQREAVGEEIVQGISEMLRTEARIRKHGDTNSTPTPPSSPTHGKTFRNRFTTQSVGTVYHNEATSYKKTAHSSAHLKLKISREGDGQPSCDYARQAEQTLTSLAKQLPLHLKRDHPVILFRHEKMAVFETPSISTALRSTPSTETDWVSMVRLRQEDDWVFKEIVAFTPHIVQAPAVPLCGLPKTEPISVPPPASPKRTSLSPLRRQQSNASQYNPSRRKSLAEQLHGQRTTH